MKQIEILRQEKRESQDEQETEADLFDYEEELTLPPTIVKGMNIVNVDGDMEQMGGPSADREYVCEGDYF